MGRPQKGSHAVPTEIRILDAAEQELSARGFAAARLADIAKGAGIRRPSLLYHFETKEKLHKAVLQRLFDALRAELSAQMVGDGEFRERVLGLMRAYVLFVERRPTFASLVLRELLDGSSEVQVLLVGELAPLLDLVESWMSKEGGELLLPELNIRGVILQICGDVLLRAIAGPSRDVLWRGAGDTLWLTERLFFGGGSSSD